MFKIYVLRAEHLPKADFFGKSDPYCVVEHKNKNGQTYRIGKTVTLKKTLNPTWDQKRELPFQYPFVRANDSLVLFKVYDFNKVKDDVLLGTCAINLNEEPLHKELAYKLNLEKSTKSNPMLFIWIDTAFDGIEPGEPLLRQHNYLYVYMKFPPQSPGGTTADLQVYHCSKINGGLSTNYTKQNNKPGLVERQVFKTPFTDGCEQMYMICIDNLDEGAVFLPMVKVNTFPGEFTITYALFAFNDLPAMGQDKEGVFEYDKLVFDPVFNPRFTPVLIHQHTLPVRQSPELYSDSYSISFTEQEVVVQEIAPVVQARRPWPEFTVSLRKAVLPEDVKIWERIRLGTSQVYALAAFGKQHQRPEPHEIKMYFQWHGDYDVDLSICALNKNDDCVGHVSFHDAEWFNGGLVHAPPYRCKEGEEIGGLEDVTIYFDKIPSQVKALLVVLTSYKGDPLSKIEGTFQFVDNSDQFELMYYDFKTTEEKSGMMFGMFTRSRETKWDYFPSFIYMDVQKPYDAHRSLKNHFKSSQYIANQYEKNNRRR